MAQFGFRKIEIFFYNDINVIKIPTELYTELSNYIPANLWGNVKLVAYFMFILIFFLGWEVYRAS